MKRLLSVMILGVMMLAIVPSLAAEQKSIPAEYISGGYDGLFIVNQTDPDRCYLYDEDGKLVLESPENGLHFQSAYVVTPDNTLERKTLVDGKCIVVTSFDMETMRSKCGLVNKNGELLCACEYDSLNLFSEGIAVVNQGVEYQRQAHQQVPVG